MYAEEYRNDPNTYLNKFEELRQNAISENYHDIAADCLYYKARCFYFNNKTDSSVANAERAIEEAEKYNIIYVKAKTKGLLALEFSRKGLTDRAIDQLEDALQMLPVGDHNNRALLSAMGIQIAFHGNDSQKEDDYSDSCLREARLSGNKTRLRSAYFAKGKMSLESENYVQAEAYFKKAAALSDPRDNFQNAHLHMAFGELYFKQQKYDSAISRQMNALKSAMIVKDKRLLLQIYNQLKKSYKATDNIKNYQLSDENSIRLRDTLDVLNIHQQQAVLRAMEKELKKSHEQEKNNYVMACAGALFILLFILFLFLKHYKKTQKLKNVFLEKEVLLNREQQKNKQLEGELRKDVLADLLSSATENHPLFLNKYKKVYPAFFETLDKLSSELTTEDLKCCAMMHMNLSAKEMAGYTYSSIRTVENRKYRIRKKLNLCSSVDLNKFLMNV
ncbi:tetratricopeptide repeat protein [Chryseobacterium pennipullorum]|nr:hypothetical protein [Chryseobacterium pennipullorum]